MRQMIGTIFFENLFLKEERMKERFLEPLYRTYLVQIDIGYLCYSLQRDFVQFELRSKTMR